MDSLVISTFYWIMLQQILITSICLSIYFKIFWFIIRTEIARMYVLVFFYLENKVLVSHYVPQAGLKFMISCFSLPE